ncbi:MAG TPA: response regulator [Candidatus Sulfotelmatobacter sp.]|nr:response regulator [Candidatus Sulfotelmatobacter sp.]
MDIEIDGDYLLTSSVRVFVVDDHEPFRRVVVSMLRKQPELQIIGEASNGLEAVQKAEELEPDLILLDIGLPRLNGIEAARRIRKLSPKSKIVFVSQECSADVVQEALSLGVLGYVVKTHAGKDLLAAVEAVLQGRLFLGSGLSEGHFTDAIASGNDEQTHVVQFYTGDKFWRDNIGKFLCATVSEGKSVIVCATPPHVAAVRQRMHAHDIDVQQLEKVGRFITLDAADTLLKFMNSDLPNQGKFESLLGPVIRHAEAAAVAKTGRVAIIGEMVALLWAAERVDATIKLEQLWNGLTRTHSFHLRCAYPASGFQGKLLDRPYASICALHSAIMPV